MARLISEVLLHYLPSKPSMYLTEPAKDIREANPRAKFAVKCNCNTDKIISHASSETIARMMWDVHNERNHGAKDAGAVTVTV